MSVAVKIAFLLYLVAIARGEEEAGEATEPTPTRELLFVAELCRHGDRSPLYEFPADSFPITRWPEGIGQLTAIGMRAHYELGTRLRARYVDSGFLPSSYSPADIYVRSTNIDRTLMSATAQMTGLYPPGTATNADVRVRFGKDPLHENEGGLPHLFQPVPVHTESRETDGLLLPGNFCPRHDILMREKLKSPEFLRVTEENRDFIEQVGKISGKKESFSVFDVERISDTWTCFAAHSVPLPEEATPDIIGKAKNLSNWLLTFGNEGLEVNRLRAGLLLYELNLYMSLSALRSQNKLPSSYSNYVKKFVLFSAHDTTVAATLAAMQVFDGLNPPYNSTLIWELYKSSDGTFSIRVEYNGKAPRLPGCSDEYCPAAEFVDSIKDRVVQGAEMRAIECLTGLRRLAAVTYHYFSKKKEDQLLSPFGLPSDGQGFSFMDAVIPSLLMLVVAVVGIVGVLRVRSRYKGYSPTASREMGQDEYGVLSSRNDAADRRILM